MKKFVLLTATILFLGSCFAQNNSSLSNFLNKDLTQIMQSRIDSLSHQLYIANQDLDEKKEQLGDMNMMAPEIIYFLLLLHKLENNLPLNKQDSMMVTRSASASGTELLTINVDVNTLGFINQNDSTYMNSFPRLQQMIAEQKLTFLPYALGRESAPAIELPPMPSATGNNKQRIANAWMQYIYDLSSRCNVARDQVNNYFTIEKTKVPNGNLDKIIELRQKFSLFIQENYCNK